MLWATQPSLASGVVVVMVTIQWGDNFGSLTHERKRRMRSLSAAVARRAESLDVDVPMLCEFADACDRITEAEAEVAVAHAEAADVSSKAGGRQRE